MMPVGASGSRPGGGAKSALITAVDDDDTGIDIDRHTRLVSARRSVTDELIQWCLLVITERPVSATAVDGNDVPAMCHFLETHAEWLSWHRDAEDAADRIGGCAPECEAKALVATHSCAGLVQSVRRHTPPPIVDKPRPPRPHHIGTCPMLWEAETEEGGLEMRECGGNVRAFPTPFTDPTREEQIAQPLPTCDKCGTDAHIDWWYREMYGQHGVSHLVTADELVAVIAVRLDYIATRDQIRQWKQRGRIVADSKDSKGRTLYRHEDVIVAIEGDVDKLKAKRGRVHS